MVNVMFMALHNDVGFAGALCMALGFGMLLLLVAAEFIWPQPRHGDRLRLAEIERENERAAQQVQAARDLSSLRNVSTAPWQRWDLRPWKRARQSMHVYPGVPHTPSDTVTLIPEGDDIFTVRRGAPDTKGAPSR